MMTIEVAICEFTIGPHVLRKSPSVSQSIAQDGQPQSSSRVDFFEVGDCVIIIPRPSWLVEELSVRDKTWCNFLSELALVNVC